MVFKRRKRVPGDHNWGLYIGLGIIAAVVIGLVLFVGARGDGDDSATSEEEVATESTTTTAPPTDQESDAALPAGSGDCSVSQFAGGPLAANDGLPDRVATRRELVGEAVVVCDFDTLESLMDADFIWSLGQPEGPAPAIAEWRSQEGAGEPILLRLAQVISLDYAQAEGGTYVFPAASQLTPEQWAGATPEQLAPLVAVYGQEAVDRWVSTGAFDGYRVGIREDGTWHYFNGSGL